MLWGRANTAVLSLWMVQSSSWRCRIIAWAALRFMHLMFVSCYQIWWLLWTFCPTEKIHNWAKLRAPHLFQPSHADWHWGSESPSPKQCLPLLPRTGVIQQFVCPVLNGTSQPSWRWPFTHEQSAANALQFWKVCVLSTGICSNISLYLFYVCIYSKIISPTFRSILAKYPEPTLRLALTKHAAPLNPPVLQLAVSHSDLLASFNNWQDHASSQRSLFASLCLTFH